jgi:hypothetical protein
MAAAPPRRARMIMYDRDIGKDEGYVWWFLKDLTYDSREGEEDNDFLIVMPEPADRKKLKELVLKKLQELGIEPEDPENPYYVKVPSTFRKSGFVIEKFTNTDRNRLTRNIQVEFVLPARSVPVSVAPLPPPAQGPIGAGAGPPPQAQARVLRDEDPQNVDEDPTGGRRRRRTSRKKRKSKKHRRYTRRR